MLTLGIVLMVVGAALLVAEAHVVSYGLLGLGGAAALTAGVAVALGAAGAPGAVVVLAAALLAAVALTAAALLVRAGARVARRRVRTGPEALVGKVGVVRAPPRPRGQVLLDGALWGARRAWAAEDEPPLECGDAVVVESINGLTL